MQGWQDLFPSNLNRHVDLQSGRAMSRRHGLSMPVTNFGVRCARCHWQGTVVLCKRRPQACGRAVPDKAAALQVAVYDLWSKVSTGVKPSLDGFTITNTSVAYTPENAMIMRFRRAFEAEFVPGLEQVCGCR